MRAILEGIRVVELALLHAGPYAAATLGSYGAEVLKIEEPGVGDQIRGLSHQYGISVTTASGRSAAFEDLNTSKKSVTLNLKTPAGKEILYDLLKKSDVFITNYRQSALERMGADYETLRRYNARLIYGLVSPMGLRGPDSELPGIDMVGQARSGIMMASGEVDTPPVLLPSGTSDRVSAIFLTQGIIAALFARERLGIGQLVHVSLLGAMINLQGHPISSMLLLGDEMTPRFNRLKSQNPLYNYFQCKDGQWIALPLYAERDFPILCQHLDLGELVDDPRFADAAARAVNTAALHIILEKTFITKTASEWQQILRHADLLHALVQKHSDLLSDPQVLANDYIINWDHPIEGYIRYIGFPVEFDQTPMKYSSAAPEIGQHTEEVLQNILGYSWEQINHLRDDGIV